MLKEASKILEIVMEFCRENTNMVIIAGAALIAVVLLVVIVSLVRGSKDVKDVTHDETVTGLEEKQSLEDVYSGQLSEIDKAEVDEIETAKDITELELIRENFEADLMQENFEVELMQKNFEVDMMEEILKGKSALEINEEELIEEENLDEELIEEEFLEEELVEEENLDEEIIEEELTEDVVEEELEQDVSEDVTKEIVEEVAVQYVIEEKQHKSFSKNTLNLEDIIEGIAELSGQGVRNVEIILPGAEVKITYRRKETENPLNNIDGEKVDVETLEENEEQVVDKAQEESLFNGDKAPAIKKFGPNNMNVSRSGKVFSEEELQMQIRD